MEHDVPDFKWVIFVGSILIFRVVYVIDTKKKSGLIKMLFLFQRVNESQGFIIGFEAVK